MMPEALELVLHHVEQQPVQPFHHRERLEIGAEEILLRGGLRNAATFACILMVSLRIWHFAGSLTQNHIQLVKGPKPLRRSDHSVMRADSVDDLLVPRWDSLRSGNPPIEIMVVFRQAAPRMRREAPAPVPRDRRRRSAPRIRSISRIPRRQLRSRSRLSRSPRLAASPLPAVARPAQLPARACPAPGPSL